MTYLTAATFLFAGIINIMPVLGTLSAGHVAKIYALGTLTPDLSLLLRHRALLFGIVGMLLITAAFKPELRTLSALAGLLSMLSFSWFVFGLDNSNPSLIRAAWIDVGASVVLIAGLVAHYLR